MINVPIPQLQVDFAFLLNQARDLYLQEALGRTVGQIDIAKVDAELASIVPGSYLSGLAQNGLRGELLFPVPCILTQTPQLLSYYRLLLGYSKKEFYKSAFGTSPFKSMEEKGKISKVAEQRLLEICTALTQSACFLMDQIGAKRISRNLLDDLTLLTLGPQLRGSSNVAKGVSAIAKVFDAIHGIVAHHAQSSGSTLIDVLNAAGRQVLIEFAPDPDIIIRERMSSGGFRNIIAIEVKGGTDYSNIHNRLGEAEKSHQKARQMGFVECWTVFNVMGLDIDQAKRESPSTNQFYHLDDLETSGSDAWHNFRNRIVSLTGIPD